MIKCLLAECWARRENIWLSVRIHGPQAKHFPAQPSCLVNVRILLYFFSCWVTVGAAFTRFQTLRLQKVFPDVLSENLISYGKYFKL